MCNLKKGKIFAAFRCGRENVNDDTLSRYDHPWGNVDRTFYFKMTNCRNECPRLLEKINFCVPRRSLKNRPLFMPSFNRSKLDHLDTVTDLELYFYRRKNYRTAAVSYVISSTITTNNAKYRPKCVNDTLVCFRISALYEELRNR